MKVRLYLIIQMVLFISLILYQSVSGSNQNKIVSLIIGIGIIVCFKKIWDSSFDIWDFDFYKNIKTFEDYTGFKDKVENNESSIEEIE